MFNIRIVSGDKSLKLGHSQSKYKLTSVTGLDGISVHFSEQSGYGQVGVVHSAPTVGGRAIAISGMIDNFQPADLTALESIVKPMEAVRVVFDEKYYIDCTVAQSVGFAANLRSMAFTFDLSAPYPWWQSMRENSEVLGGLVGGFNFPISYDVPHNYALFSESLFVNCVNDGDTDVFFSASISMRSGSAENITIRNAATQEYLTIYTEITADDVIEVFREDGVLRVTKTTNGITQDIFHLLDEDSNLFELHTGDNVLRATAEDGDEEQLIIRIAYHDTKTGVRYGVV